MRRVVGFELRSPRRVTAMQFHFWICLRCVVDLADLKHLMADDPTRGK